MKSIFRRPDILRLPPLLLVVLSMPGGLFATPGNGFPAPGDGLRSKEGFLDLSNHDFSRDGSVLLAGEWEFYWNELLSPQDFREGRPSVPSFRHVPANWKTYNSGDGFLPLYGFGTYRLKIRTEGGQNEFGLRLKRIYSAYRVYVNDAIVVETGVIKRNLDEVVPRLPVKTAFFSSSSRDLDVVIQVANPYYYRSGILYPPELGTQEQISRKQVFALSIDVFLLGVIAIMSVYFLVLFFLIPDYRMSSLYFSLFCLVVGLRVMLITGERILYQLIPDMSLFLDSKIQAFGIYPLIPTFLACIFNMFPARGNPKIVRFITVASAGYLIASLVTSPKFGGPILMAYYPFLVVGLGYMLIIILRAIKAEEPDAKREFFGFLFIISAAVYDMMVDREIVHTDYVLPLGLLAFIFIQSITLSGRYSQAFTRLKALLEENRRNQGALESRVQERTSTLRKLNESLILARNQAEEANSAKSRFLQNMSHEMRTPLHGILGYAELIRETDPKPIHGSYAGKIMDESKNLLDLITQLLDLSKIEAGRLNIDPHPFDLFELLRSVHDLLVPLAEKKELQFRIIIKETVPQHLCGDAARLRQILVNLGGNAIKFTKSGWVEIKCECQENLKDTAVVLFIIQDTGIGIARDFQQVIFDRFTQAQAGPSRIYGGTGLGTTIAKQLTELMKGSIGLSSEEGKGSTFWVSIPFPKATADQVRSESETGIEPSGPSLGGNTVLLVEDYPTTQQITRHHLESAGLEVIIAENGIKGIQCLGKHTVDCILMDVQMPQMDGLEATRLIRKLPNWGKVPIIGMTASAFEEDIRACLDAGMNDVLTKPLRKRDLIKKLSEYLAPRSAAPEVSDVDGGKPEPIRFGDFVKEMDGELGNVRAILEGFLRQLAEQTERIERAFREGNFRDLHREAHSVKGGALNVFALPLSEAARELEEAAKSGDAGRIAGSVDRFRAEAEETRRAIPPLLASDGAWDGR